MGRILKLILLLAVLVFWIDPLGISPAELEPNSILRLKLSGPLSEQPMPDVAQMLTEGLGSSLPLVTEGIRRAAQDSRIAGLVLELPAQGLGGAQLAELEEAMAAYRNTGKWNIAFLETAGESSGGDALLALAATADEIALAPPGEVHLYGLRAEVPFVAEALKKLDVQAHFEQRYAYKNAANTFTQSQFTEAHKEATSSLLDDLQQTLVAHLAKRRDQTPKAVQNWIAQGTFSAIDAQKQGIVDKLTYWDGIAEEAVQLAGRDDPFVDIDTYLAATMLGESADGPEIAYIVAEGNVVRGDNASMSDPAVASDALAEAFRTARRDKVRGVLLRISSPGGSYIASDLIRREILLTRQAGIPIVASMGNVAASGGYFIAMPCDRIFAQPATVTGSIGVVAGTFSIRSILKKVGITFDGYSPLPSKGRLSFLDPPSKDARAMLSQSLDRIYQDFIQKAAQDRRMDVEEIHALAQGRVWTGKQAQKSGLVDSLGGLKASLDSLKELAGIPEDTEVVLRILPEPKSPLQALRQLMQNGLSGLVHVQSWMQTLQHHAKAHTLQLRLPKAALSQ